MLMKWKLVKSEWKVWLLLQERKKKRMFGTVKTRDYDGSKRRKWSFVTVPQQSKLLVSLHHFVAVQEIVVTNVAYIVTIVNRPYSVYVKVRNGR